MIKTFPILLALSLLLASCITFAPETQVPAEPSFVTSTLPPTRSLVTRSTVTPSGIDGTTTPTLAVTVPADCKVVAVLIEDVTIPDGTQLAAGKSFTKTWKFKNTGTCPWSGYKLAFVSGDRMAAPDSAPVQQTLPDDFVNISVNLVAPSADGSYTGFFELRNADGELVPIGLEKTFWVKIVVGAGGIPPATGSTPSSGGATPGTPEVTTGTGECRDTGSPSYVSELLSLINEARAAAGVPALSLDSRLAAAAQAHSVDMACNNMISHTGSDGSTIGQRIVAAGYSPSWYVEIIAVGGPQDAMAQWKASPDHWNAVLSRYATQVGIGWADSPNSVYGGSIAVDLASP